MQVDDPARDREAEPGPTIGRSIEAFEHPRGLFVRDARTLVIDLTRR